MPRPPSPRGKSRRTRPAFPTRIEPPPSPALRNSTDSKSGHKDFRRLTFAWAAGRHPAASNSQTCPLTFPPGEPAARPPHLSAGRAHDRANDRADNRHKGTPPLPFRRSRGTDLAGPITFARLHATSPPAAWQLPGRDSPAGRHAAVSRPPPSRPPGREPTASRLDGRHAANGRLGNWSTSRLKVGKPAGRDQAGLVKAALTIEAFQQGGKYTKPAPLPRIAPADREGPAARSAPAAGKEAAAVAPAIARSPRNGILIFCSHFRLRLGGNFRRPFPGRFALRKGGLFAGALCRKSADFPGEIAVTSSPHMAKFDVAKHHFSA